MDEVTPVTDPPNAAIGKSYKIICISIYLTDLAELDRRVVELKAAGLTWMSRSALLRLALRGFDDKTLLDRPKR